MAVALQKHNATTLEELHPGDLVEFDRGMYSHWAVYKGKGRIIHLAGDENDGLNANLNSGNIFTICGRRFNKAFVREDDFWEVTGDSKAYKNNKRDQKMTPRDGKEIVKKAMEMIGEIGYNLLWGNCEHFAKFCRYGKSKSDQVDSFLTMASVGVALAAVAGYVLPKLLGSGEEEKEKKKKESAYQ
ncbi:phospholipase A and acyltransferase 3-like [Mya arenaria]|uniref:phospholipase A and acyltransferase 3-like n=1 Tax=Mya arenaria TaxID=6604 RepID=UPI0022E3EF61|nr:phospholipase A and acyltransferase 3-like [Mya arenaria]